MSPEPAPLFRVVEADPADWQAYRALRLEALERDPAAFGSTLAGTIGRPAQFWIDRLAGEASIDLVAVVDDRLVGMIGALVADDDDPAVAWLVSMYVTRDWRGTGVAGALVNAVLARLAARPELTTARLSVNPVQGAAVRLYQRLGFQRAPDVDPEDAAKGYWCMERPIRSSPGS